LNSHARARLAPRSRALCRFAPTSALRRRSVLARSSDIQAAGWKDSACADQARSGWLGCQEREPKGAGAGRGGSRLERRSQGPAAKVRFSARRPRADPRSMLDR
jgi:hypothetical protein